MAIDRWQELNPNFSGSNNSMRNAGDNISRAGTIFGQLRESVLGQQQREKDNIRNDELLALRQDALAQEQGNFNANLKFQRDKLAADTAGRDKMLALQEAKIGQDKEEFNLKKAIYNQSIQDDNIKREIVSGLTAERDAIPGELASIDSWLNDPTSGMDETTRANLTNRKTILNARSKELSAMGLDRFARQQFSARTGRNWDNTPFSIDRDLEVKNATEQYKLASEREKALLGDDSITKALTSGKIPYDTDSLDLAMGAYSTLRNTDLFSGLTQKEFTDSLLGAIKTENTWASYIPFKDDTRTFAGKGRDSLEQIASGNISMDNPLLQILVAGIPENKRSPRLKEMIKDISLDKINQERARLQENNRIISPKSQEQLMQERLDNALGL